MAYDPTQLRLIRDLGVYKFWHYATLDTAATADTADYFLIATSTPDPRLTIGDAILIVVVTGTVAVPTGIAASTLTLVKDRTATAIDVIDGAAIATTDTD